MILEFCSLSSLVFKHDKDYFFFFFCNEVFMWRVWAANLSHLHQKIHHAVKFQNVVPEDS